jgi:hypothetical protein
MENITKRREKRSEKVWVWKEILDAQKQPWYIITVDEDIHKWDVVHLFKNLNPLWKHDYFLLKIKKNEDNTDVIPSDKT